MFPPASSTPATTTYVQSRWGFAATTLPVASNAAVGATGTTGGGSRRRTLLSLTGVQGGDAGGEVQAGMGVGWGWVGMASLLPRTQPLGLNAFAQQERQGRGQGQTERKLQRISIHQGTEDGGEGGYAFVEAVHSSLGFGHPLSAINSSLGSWSSDAPELEPGGSSTELTEVAYGGSSLVGKLSLSTLQQLFRETFDCMSATPPSPGTTAESTADTARLHSTAQHGAVSVHNTAQHGLVPPSARQLLQSSSSATTLAASG